jgi:hypothetical protein
MVDNSWRWLPSGQRQLFDWGLNMMIKSVGFILLFVFVGHARPVDDKIKLEELIAKHLESIGTADARRAGRSRIVAGGSVMNVKTGGRGSGSGAALLASQDGKVLLKAEYSGNATYPLEKFGFDGKKFYAMQYAPGARSPLAQFLMSHDTIFSEGLIGGTLSSAWPLLNLLDRDPKLQYSGTEKIKGRQAHKVKYMPRAGAELKITLFFDAETFHHVRTDYERVIPAPMGATPGASASQRESRYKLVEEFSGFRPESGLNLPHSYNLQFSVFQLNNPLALDWTINLAKYTFDYPIEAKEFMTDN